MKNPGVVRWRTEGLGVVQGKRYLLQPVSKYDIKRNNGTPRIRFGRFLAREPF